jgi:hypothetical protein
LLLFKVIQLRQDVNNLTKVLNERVQFTAYEVIDLDDLSGLSEANEIEKVAERARTDVAFKKRLVSFPKKVYM